MIESEHRGFKYLGHPSARWSSGENVMMVYDLAGKVHIGSNCVLDREEVQKLIAYLSHWLETGRLFG